MRISTKGRHAVMAMVDIARHSEERPVPLADVAQRQLISLSYLEQLVSKLKKNALVKSMRGPGGGYVLASDPALISIYQIVAAVDTPSQAERPMPHGEGQTARKLTDALWHRVGEEVQKYLKAVTLAEVVHRKS
ncbi:MAG: Rrf2 family transcriptional regulator [Bdellovibrionales bacterium]|jgi:Rrf2 family iron-sulfur cluster assembly transcriptional regulator